MLFYAFYQGLVGRNVFVTVELKNGIEITGILVAVDQYLNIKLKSVSIADPQNSPHLVGLKTCFVRGSVIRYVNLSGVPIDTEQLEDSCRRVESKKTTAVTR